MNGDTRPIEMEEAWQDRLTCLHPKGRSTGAHDQAESLHPNQPFGHRVTLTVALLKRTSCEGSPQ